MDHLGLNFAIEFPFERHQSFFKDLISFHSIAVLKKLLMPLKWKFNGKISSQVLHSSDIIYYLSFKSRHWMNLSDTKEKIFLYQYKQTPNWDMIALGLG